MELTKSTIKKYSEQINGIDEYIRIITKIENNVYTNPDIAIESCKSLIEGLCKKSLSLIDANYKSNKKKKRNQCDNDFPFLIESAFNAIFEKKVEADLNIYFAKIINHHSIKSIIINKSKEHIKSDSKTAIYKIAAIRHERGDISHGKLYPKEYESDVNLAKSIISITDGITSYMLNELVKQLPKIDTRLIYAELEEFNQWLDKGNTLLETKIDFSKLLFDHTYEKYEEIYYGEFLPVIEQFEDANKEENIIIKDNSIPQKQEKRKPTLSDNLNKLVDHFTFWDKNKMQALKLFAKTEKIKVTELRKIIDKYNFTEKEPLPDEVRTAFKKRPSLLEGRKIIPEMTIKIVEFADGLNKEKNN